MEKLVLKYSHVDLGFACVYYTAVNTDDQEQLYGLQIREDDQSFSLYKCWADGMPKVLIPVSNITIIDVPYGGTWLEERLIEFIAKLKTKGA